MVRCSKCNRNTKKIISKNSDGQPAAARVCSRCKRTTVKIEVLRGGKK